MKLSPEELHAMPAKTKKNPEVVQLYLENEFLTAYSKHTDMRVQCDGYRSAVGAAHDWERHGLLQFDFLKQQGLKPAHRLLEIGCGTGRLARKVVPYLDWGNYVGVDISRGALVAAREVARVEGWAEQCPQFLDDTHSVHAAHDYVWAFSVFIHLPAQTMTDVMREARRLMAPGGCFLFSYVPERADSRTGLKQFRHTLRTYTDAAHAAGLTFERVLAWRGEQSIAVAHRDSAAGA